MRWKTIITIDLIVSIIISVAVMMRGVMTQSRLTCGFINLAECSLRQWLIELLIAFVAVFIIIIVIAVIFKSAAGRGPRMPKMKMPKFKEPKIEKMPELGKDIDLPEDLEKEISKIKI